MTIGGVDSVGDVVAQIAGRIWWGLKSSALISYTRLDPIATSYLMRSEDTTKN